MKENNAHLTAKDRDKMSFPTNWLLRRNFLKGDILDYGCGKGADVKFLTELGHSCNGYDPFYLPQHPKQRYHTIICQYVFNVLEHKEQEKLILDITSLLARNGAAYITVRRDITYEGFRTHKIHKKTTYQRNVILPFESILKNNFCEIYKITRHAHNSQQSLCHYCQPTNSFSYIAESSHTIAVLHNSPITKGHALILPKQHIANYFDIAPDLQQELWTTTNFVKHRLYNAYHPDGFNINVDVNAIAGQTLPHCAIHLIPRYAEDI